MKIIKKARNLQTDAMAATCGSDAHTMMEMGNSYVSIPAGTRLNPNDFYNALIDSGVLHCKKSSILVHFITKYEKYKYRRQQKDNRRNNKCLRLDIHTAYPSYDCSCMGTKAE